MKQAEKEDERLLSKKVSSEIALVPSCSRRPRHLDILLEMAQCRPLSHLTFTLSRVTLGWSELSGGDYI